MTLSNEELVRRFRDGSTSGSSCNMKIEKLEKDGEIRGTILIGYNWAVYAHRTKEGSKVTLFPDWYGFSQTTSTHINLIRRYSNNEIDSVRPTKNHRQAGDNYKRIDEWDHFPFDTELEEKVHEYR